MLEIDMRCDSKMAASLVLASIRDLDGHIDYKNEGKGFFVYSQSNWNWYPNATTVVDIIDEDGGCKLRIHSFISGAFIKAKWKMAQYDRNLADSVSRLMEAHPRR